jgi:hypothetical protein
MVGDPNEVARTYSLGVRVGARLGLDRALYVRFADDGRCQLVGVRHRRPVEVPISRSYGVELAGQGFPTVGSRGRP